MMSPWRHLPCVRSLHSDDWRAMDGLHDGRQAAAQVMGWLSHFGRLFQHHPLSRAVQNPRQELTQLLLLELWHAQNKDAEFIELS